MPYYTILLYKSLYIIYEMLTKNFQQPQGTAGLFLRIWFKTPEIQDRIISFIACHSEASKEQLEQMMMNTSMLSRDLGTVLVGEEAVKKGLICEVGGICCAMDKVKQLINTSE